MLDILQVVHRSGVPASNLILYEKKGLIISVGSKGIRRLFDADVMERLALIELGRMAGFSLDEIASMFASGEGARFDKEVFANKADDLDRTVSQLIALRDGLRHASVCPAPSPMECPTFRRLLKVAVLRGIKPGEGRRRPAASS
jgi:DNA-binding transcriptional MerR regulator